VVEDEPVVSVLPAVVSSSMARVYRRACEAS
jgi:hypothetical protein